MKKKKNGKLEAHGGGFEEKEDNSTHLNDLDKNKGNEMKLCQIQFQKIKDEVESQIKKHMFLLYDKGDIKDRICQLKVSVKERILIGITWNGLLQIKCLDGNEPMMAQVVPNSRDDEFCEGLCYNSDSNLIAVSSVKLNGEDQFYMNKIYVYTLERDQGCKLSIVGSYKKKYSPTKCTTSLSLGFEC